MTILQLPRRPRSTTTPFVAMIDLQIEYIAEGREKHIAEATAAVENSVTLLREARKLQLPIGHFRMIQNGHNFNSASRFSHWIDEVKPRPNEYVYEHTEPSCFSNTAFCELMENVASPEIIFAGLSGEMACLSSAIDGYHRGFDMIFVSNCSASSTVGDWSESSTHHAVENLIACYGSVQKLDQVLDRFVDMSLRKTGS